ncbi:hypothetical protein HJFPF1_02736 [Paramyrothecium foliicola]|nr:hypothetical protein HJFPF1_02736 [Paramyrothecium foliicola]
MICSGVPVKELYDDDHRSGQGRVKEVTQPPLCAVCMVEAELDELGDKAVVQKGLRRVEKLDGGLTSRRWHAREGLRNSQGRPDMSSRRDRSRESPIHAGLDGTWGNEHKPVDSETAKERTQDVTIWVNIFDPVNRPSFKPGSLKPVPLSMQHIPGDMEVNGQQRSPGVSSPRLLGQTIVRPPRRQSSASSEASSICRREIGPLDWKSSVSYIKEEPLKRPSSRLIYRRQASENMSSVYETPPESVDEPAPLLYPRPVPRTISGGHTPSPSQPAARLRSKPQTAPPQSSEYLDRYRPLTTLERQQQTWHVVKPVKATDALLSTHAEQGPAAVSFEDHSEDGRAVDVARESGRIRGVGAELRRFFMGR